MDRLPIVYVRGFAGERGIEKAVEDPFYGFNEGSVHVRVGASGDPSFYQFESPLLRLMIDADYTLLVRGSQERYLRDAEPGSVDPASIWVHRFYDLSARSLTTEAHRTGDGEEVARPDPYQAFDLEAAARALLELIELVKDRTGAPRVFLVAHSMGGLVCRCLIQKVLPDRGEHALEHVDRLFTYGTPHGGIHFEVGFGLLERLRDTFDVQGGAIFGHRKMYDYLTPTASARRDGPEKAWRANSLPASAFPGERVFCLVGTNPSDYDAALGLSAKAVGAKSDGLVQIESAYMPEARFAFVHRSHSGRFGMVNSEEGYQNLRRFLFGDLQVTADLVDYRLPGEPDPEVAWQAETRLSIRGLPIVMHEQLAAHHCPIQLEWSRDAETADRPVPLVTTFLSSDERPRDSQKMRYTLQLRILSLRERNGVFWFGDHIEQSADFDDMLIIDIEPPGEQRAFPRAWGRWASMIPTPLREYEPADRDLLTDDDPEPGSWVANVALPSPGGDFLGAGTRLRLVVRGRRPAADPAYRR
ncbi:MAG: esterase/lipase family protein [Egibacteraceae bacterium]